MQFQNDLKEITVKGLLNGAMVAGISRFAFDERGQIFLPIINRSFDVIIPLAVAGAISSIVSDTMGYIVRDNVQVPLQYQKAGKIAIDVAINGGSLALATYGLVGLEDMNNVLMTMALGAGSKLGTDYIADNFVLKNKQGFIL
jgi:hypothetical protein